MPDAEIRLKLTADTSGADDIKKALQDVKNEAEKPIQPQIAPPNAPKPALPSTTPSTQLPNIGGSQAPPPGAAPITPQSIVEAIKATPSLPPPAGAAPTQSTHPDSGSEPTTSEHPEPAKPPTTSTPLPPKPTTATPLPVQVIQPPVEPKPISVKIPELEKPAPPPPPVQPLPPPPPKPPTAQQAAPPQQVLPRPPVAPAPQQQIRQLLAPPPQQPVERVVEKLAATPPLPAPQAAAPKVSQAPEPAKPPTAFEVPKPANVAPQSVAPLPLPTPTPPQPLTKEPLPTPTPPQPAEQRPLPVAPLPQPIAARQLPTLPTPQAAIELTKPPTPPQLALPAPPPQPQLALPAPQIKPLLALPEPAKPTEAPQTKPEGLYLSGTADSPKKQENRTNALFDSIEQGFIDLQNAIGDPKLVSGLDQLTDSAKELGLELGKPTPSPSGGTRVPVSNQPPQTGTNTGGLATPEEQAAIAKTNAERNQRLEEQNQKIFAQAKAKQQITPIDTTAPPPPLKENVLTGAGATATEPTSAPAIDPTFQQSINNVLKKRIEGLNVSTEKEFNKQLLAVTKLAGAAPTLKPADFGIATKPPKPPAEPDAPKPRDSNKFWESLTDIFKINGKEAVRLTFSLFGVGLGLSVLDGILEAVIKKFEEFVEAGVTAQQAQRELAATFGDSAKEYQEFIEATSHQPEGFSAIEIGKVVQSFQPLANQLHLTTAQVQALTTAAAQLADIRAVPLSTAANALTSALQGSSGAADQLGLDLSDVALATKAADGEFSTGLRFLTDYQRAQLALSLATKELAQQRANLGKEDTSFVRLQREIATASEEANKNIGNVLLEPTQGLLGLWLEILKTVNKIGTIEPPKIFNVPKMVDIPELPGIKPKSDTENISALEQLERDKKTVASQEAAAKASATPPAPPKPLIPALQPKPTTPQPIVQPERIGIDQPKPAEPRPQPPERKPALTTPLITSAPNIDKDIENVAGAFKDAKTAADDFLSKNKEIEKAATFVPVIGGLVSIATGADSARDAINGIGDAIKNLPIPKPISAEAGGLANAPTAAPATAPAEFANKPIDTSPVEGITNAFKNATSAAGDFIDKNEELSKSGGAAVPVVGGLKNIAEGAVKAKDQVLNLGDAIKNLPIPKIEIPKIELPQIGPSKEDADAAAKVAAQEKAAADARLQSDLVIATAQDTFNKNLDEGEKKTLALSTAWDNYARNIDKAQASIEAIRGAVTNFSSLTEKQLISLSQKEAGAAALRQKNLKEQTEAQEQLRANLEEARTAAIPGSEKATEIDHAIDSLNALESAYTDVNRAKQESNRLSLEGVQLAGQEANAQLKALPQNRRVEDLQRGQEQNRNIAQDLTRTARERAAAQNNIYNAQVALPRARFEAFEANEPGFQVQRQQQVNTLLQQIAASTEATKVKVVDDSIAGIQTELLSQIAEGSRDAHDKAISMEVHISADPGLNVTPGRIVITPADQGDRIALSIQRGVQQASNQAPLSLAGAVLTP